MDEAGSWHGGRPQPMRLCVRWGPSPLLQKGAQPPPQFSAHFYCGQTAGCIKMLLGMDVGLCPGDFVLDGDPVPLPKMGAEPPKFSADIYYGQTDGWIKMPLGTKVGLSPDDSVLDGDPDPSPQGVEPPPQFLAHFYCGHTAGCIKMPLDMEVGLSPGDFVLDGGVAPQFSAHVYCGQRTGWIKMALGMEVGLGPVHIVLDGDPAPTPKGAGRHPIFGPRLLWPYGCMDQYATWYGGKPRPTRDCVRCGPSYPQKKGTPTPPNFWPMSIVAKWLDG